MSIKLTDVELEASMDQGIGYCLSCKAERDCCEPDAEQYECYECGELEVCGTELLLIMGQIELVEEVECER